MTPSPTSPVPLIGLSGFSGAGKDTAAAAVLNLGWRRVAFADKLRQVAYALDPIVVVDSGPAGPVRLAELVDTLGWEATKRSYLEVRRLLQRLGTDAGRQVLGDDLWVEAALGDLHGPTVITDVRFRNEAAAIRARGGFVFRIERPGVGALVGADGQVHPSETALAGFDFDAVLENGGSPDDLAALMVEAVGWMFPTGH